jgi:hypothetical protein
LHANTADSIVGGVSFTEVDGSITNEIQDLQLEGNNLTITNNGTATAVDLSPYLDNTDTQLDSTGIATLGFVAGAHTVNTDTQLDSTDIANLGYNAGGITTEVDGSVTNEIQTIRRTGTTVTLSDGGGTFQDSVGVYTSGTGIDITNNVISTTGNSTLTIGDSYQGGKIFWLDASGQHGLIAATADQSTGIQWYNGSNTTTNSVRDGIGAGKFNTERIIANQGPGAYAAQICANYKGGNYGDWYLPSKYELNLLYLQKAAIGGFRGLDYWSSTEYGSNDAWITDFANGFPYYYNKSNGVSVRSVRAF